MTPIPDYINPVEACEPLGMYSHVARAGDLLFVAGQVGVNPDGSLAGIDLKAQVPQAFENLRIILESLGASMRHIVKFTTYLTHEGLVPKFYAAREGSFAEHYPDRSCPPNTLLVIDRLVSPDYLVEIEAIAHVG